MKNSSFNKIIELDEHFKGASTFEPTVQLLHSNSKIKVASEASDWSRSVSPEPGKTFILVLAMGASEYYGPNRNGDAFREAELIKKYKTFETNAHVFRSHVNKDPAKSMGSVVKAFYNNDMHRVELILKLNNSDCPDIVDKIHAGENVAVSMGCRIEFDVCTICGNKAPSRKEYCDHLLNELNDIYPDGRIVAADNPDPNFFDISVVYKPADKTGYMLKKVASLNSFTKEAGLPSSLIAEKVAARTAIAKYLTKAADIEKIVTGVGFAASSGNTNTSSDSDSLSKKWLLTIVPKLTKSHMDISDTDLAEMSARDFPKVINTLSKMGIFLTTPEFLDLMFMKITGNKAPEGLASKLISLQGDIFSLLSKHPDIAEDLISSGSVATGTEGTDSRVEAKLSSYIPFRSLLAGNILHPAKATKVASYGSSSLIPSCTNYDKDLLKFAAVSLACYKINVLETCSNNQNSDIELSKSNPSYNYKIASNMPWVPYTLSAIDRTKCSKGFTKVSSFSTTRRLGNITRNQAENLIVDLILS
jgi:hypothetical protein